MSCQDSPVSVNKKNDWTLFICLLYNLFTNLPINNKRNDKVKLLGVFKFGTLIYNVFMYHIQDTC